jgi:hypothetical protein
MILRFPRWMRAFLRVTNDELEEVRKTRDETQQILDRLDGDLRAYLDDEDLFWTARSAEDLTCGIEKRKETS